MVTNPTLPDILADLEPGQTLSDRPDLIARVFKFKLDQMVALLLKSKISGHVMSYDIRSSSNKSASTCT